LKTSLWVVFFTVICESFYQGVTTRLANCPGLAEWGYWSYNV